MEKKIIKDLIFVALGIAILVSAVLFWASSNRPGKLDDFAKCVSASGTKFYGAFWCVHCQNQKKLFGRSEKHLPYIECSTPDSNNRLKICEDAKIIAYPTWEFKDSSRLTGELTLQDLAQKTNCEVSK